MSLTLIVCLNLAHCTVRFQKFNKILCFKIFCFMVTANTLRAFRCSSTPLRVHQLHKEYSPHAQFPVMFLPIYLQ